MNMKLTKRLETLELNTRRANFKQMKSDTLGVRNSENQPTGRKGVK